MCNLKVGDRVFIKIQVWLGDGPKTDIKGEVMSISGFELMVRPLRYKHLVHLYMNEVEKIN